MKVEFTPEAFAKIRAYILGIDYEISGFGKVEKTKDALVVTDVKIFQQVVSAGNTIMDARGLAKFWDDLTVAGEDIGKWKLWWHSHVFMHAMFSGTDYDTIDEFDTETPEENWMLSIVGNKLGHMTCQVDIFQPIRCTIAKLKWDTQPGELPQVDVSAEIQEKVTTRNLRYTPEEEKNLISWDARQSLPPMVQDGKVLSFQERAAIFRATGHWPAFPKNASLDIIDMRQES